MKLETGQIWRKPDGEEIEILDVLDGLLVEVRFSRDNGPCWVMKSRFIGPAATCEFVRGKGQLLLTAA